MFRAETRQTGVSDRMVRGAAPSVRVPRSSWTVPVGRGQRSTDDSYTGSRFGARELTCFVNLAQRPEFLEEANASDLDSNNALP